MKPIVLLVEPIHPHFDKLLRRHCRVVRPEGFTDEALRDAARDAAAILIRTNGRVTADLIKHATNLKVIGRHGVGVDHIDISAATRAGIWVANTPAGSLEAVAEHAWMMILALAHHACGADRSVRKSNFEFRSGHEILQMEGRTIGILGLGRIGSRVAEIATRGFRMKVKYTDLIRYPSKERKLKAVKVSCAELLRSSDVVTIHVPLTDKTRGLIGSRELARMKQSALLINCARGKVVDGYALAAALREGRPAGAGLDVFEEEPPPADHPLLQCENAIFSPHNAAQTAEARFNYGKIVLDILRVLEGKKPVFAVNQPR